MISVGVARKISLPSKELWRTTVSLWTASGLAEREERGRWTGTKVTLTSINLGSTGELNSTYLELVYCIFSTCMLFVLFSQTIAMYRIDVPNLQEDRTIHRTCPWTLPGWRVCSTHTELHCTGLCSTIGDLLCHPGCGCGERSERNPPRGAAILLQKPSLPGGSL